VPTRPVDQVAINLRRVEVVEQSLANIGRAMEALRLKRIL